MEDSDSNMDLPIDVNVLIIGGTGQGKSFFINMFDKMAVCATLAEAERNPGDFVQPIKFYHKGKYIVEGGDKGGDYSQAHSQTQEPTIYEYPTRYGTLRLIDTPGTGDTQGSDTDEKHVEKIISCICQFDKIHAILLFFKSTDNRLDDRVKYQLCELLSCLGKSAVNNIQFVITHGGVLAEVGQAPTVIESFIKELAVDIPFSENNTFCFENDPLKYLVLKQQGNSSYDEDDVDLFKITYRRTAAQYVRLFATAFKCPQPYSTSQYRALAVARQIWPRLTMTVGEKNSVKEAIEDALKKHDGNFDQILQRLAVCETNLEKTKSSQLSDVALTGLVIAGTVAGGAALLVAGPAIAAGGALFGLGASLYGAVRHKKGAKEEQESVEDKLRSERSRKEQEAKAIEAQRDKYIRFTSERAKVKQLDEDFARCLHQNTVLAFTSAKAQILKQELKNAAQTLSAEERKRLEQKLEEVKGQRKVLKQVAGGQGLDSLLGPEELLEKINGMCAFEYYGPPIKKALEECNLVNAATFDTIVRAESACGYIFEKIIRQCFPEKQ